MNLSYILIPLITILTGFLGGRITSDGMEWYRTINLPAWTPPGSIIGLVWMIIFILTTISALIVWNTFPRENRFAVIVGLFLVNAVLNLGWSHIFFGVHALGWSVVEAALLELSVLALIFLIWPLSRWTAVLIFPYAAWVMFATYLTYSVWSLN